MRRNTHLLLIFAELVQHLRVNDWHTLRSTPIDGLLLRILEAILLCSGAIIKKKAHKYVFVNIQMRVSLAKVASSVSWQQDEI